MTTHRLIEMRNHLLNKEPIDEPVTASDMATLFALAEKHAQFCQRVYMEGWSSAESHHGNELFEAGRQFMYGHLAESGA